MQQLQNKTAIVTGASAGIGRASAKLFASHGAHLVLSGRRTAELKSIVFDVHTAGGKAIAVEGDVTDPNHHKELVDTAKEHFGGLDVAFNNAGILGQLGPVDQLTQEDWGNCIETNLSAAFYAAQSQLPLLEENGGSIIFSSSFVGTTIGMPNMVAYAAAKAGLGGLMRTIAAEYGQKNVRANNLIIGGTDTESLRSFATNDDILGFVKSLYALKRIAEPEEIAKAALFLASDASSFVTGSEVPVEGGIAINRT